MILQNEENSGTEEIGLVTPTPGRVNLVRPLLKLVELIP